ncbi:MAG: M56 family metallopeptidase, partial [Bacteroides sp.]|nr:M56 family metallopeptidase [Bacteroides sp.]
METLYAILPLAGRYILVAGLLMALYWMLWRKQATHRAKRIYLLALPFMALAITLIQIEVYKPDPVVVTIEKKVEAVQNISMAEAIPMTTSATTVAPTEVNEAEEAIPVALAPMEAVEEAINLSTLNIITIVYISILVALCIPFVVGFVQLMMLSKKANKQQDKEKNIRILTGQAIKAPFSFYRSIFLPSNLTDTQRRMILSHEEAHIQHRHYLDMWISALITRLFWWNPFLWWANNELRNIHEFEADGVVLNTGEDLYTYQTILIEEVMHGDIVIANGFNHSFIRRRFIEMAKSTNRRMSKWGKIGTGVWMLLIVALFCCSVGKAETIYKTVITHEPQELVAEAVTETEAIETLPIEEEPIATEDIAAIEDTIVVVHVDSTKQTKEVIGYALPYNQAVEEILPVLDQEQADILGSLLSTIGSLQEITPEQYEKLQTQSNRPLPSLESINQSMRNIKLNMNNRFSESLSRLLLDMVRTQNSFLTSSQLADLVDKESGVAFISPTLPKTFEFQSQLVQQLMTEWLFNAEITEEAYMRSRELSENVDNYPSLEEINKNIRESSQRRFTTLLSQIKQSDESLAKQVEEQMAKYGMLPKEDVIEIPITFKGGKVMIYKKDGNGFRSYEANSRQAAYENIRKAKENEFVIEGFVDENITDSCYNIYLADEHFLIQDEPVATVPVVNKRFTYVLKLDKMTAGRLRCIFPGGELCENTISLYFVPGETVSLFVHNGFYNLRKSEEYDDKVNNAIDAIREETEWKTPHQPKIKGEAWKEVKHKQNYYN